MTGSEKRPLTSNKRTHMSLTTDMIVDGGIATPLPSINKTQSISHCSKIFSQKTKTEWTKSYCKK